MLTNMKFFENWKTAKLYHEILNGLAELDKDTYREAVTELFHRKQVSEPGEFTVFKITEKDLYRLKEELDV